jgi:hypothetical protein
MPHTAHNAATDIDRLAGQLAEVMTSEVAQIRRSALRPGQAVSV